ncbi:MAG: argininosuccinate lyase, partial [Candidatus Aminicenantes bacterium]|nr:argininosuccinate lyase [Candidatus Aminicenantes bacterium]
KGPLMKGFRVTLETIRIMKLVMAHLEVNTEKCQKACTEEIYSAEKAHGLVKKGIAFREAYRKVAKDL